MSFNFQLFQKDFGRDEMTQVHTYHRIPGEREDKRGRRPISELRIRDIKCEKCNIMFESKKEKKRHVSQYHRI